jgi:hypothetical protein
MGERTSAGVGSPVASGGTGGGSRATDLSQGAAWQRALFALVAASVLLYVGVRLGRMVPESTAETVRWNGGPNYNSAHDLRYAASVANAEHRYADALRMLDEAKALYPNGEDDKDIQRLRGNVTAGLAGRTVVPEVRSE